jgi:4-hydroxythreonine-4-phosphate dehydrogenase
VVHVDGRPLATSSRDGDVVALLERGGLRAAAVGLTDLAEGRLPDRLAEAYAAGLDAVVVDGEDDTHLDAVVEVGRGDVPVVLVGSGGLTRPLAGPAAATPTARPEAARGPTLLVVGSRAEASRAQRERLLERGVTPVLLPPGDPAPPDTAERVRRALHEGPVVLSPDPAAPVVRADAPAVARALARTVVAVIPELGTLVATGGETARAVLTTAGADHLVVTGEVEPGVVRGHVPGLDLDLVTKAGAFGDPDALLRCLPASVRNPRGTP